MTRGTIGAAAAFAALALAAAAAEAQSPDGRVLALSCFNCHGPNGKSPGPIPSLAGKSAAILKATLVEFRDGKRTGAAATVMTRLAKGYSDAEIDAVSAYLATLK
jgi:sulfide dehydrogenase cytochrome subunit